MRYCPTCNTKYDDEVVRFCTKDGTPLVGEEKPSFTNNLPSESSTEADDIGEETVIRRRPPKIPPVSEIPEEEPVESSEPEAKRIVISTSEEGSPGETSGRDPESSRTAARQRHVNIPLVILFTVVGTLFVVGAALGVVFLLTYESGAEADSNANQELNANLNENAPDNFNANDLLDPNLNSITVQNANTNANANANTNVNVNSETPSPTPTPDTNSNVNIVVPDSNTGLPANVNNNAVQPAPPGQPAQTPPISPGPTADPSTNTNRPVNIGNINGRAVTLPMPVYPQRARAVRATGRVDVQVVLDEFGRVVAAKAISGHPFLRRSAEDAAMRSRFRPAIVGGRRVRANGTILYNFVN